LALRDVLFVPYQRLGCFARSVLPSHRYVVAAVQKIHLTKNCFPLTFANQASALAVWTRLHELEKSLRTLHSICTQCVGGSEAGALCSSTVCPVLFERHHLGRLIERQAVLRQLSF
jgi:hypothetical protein